MFIARCWRYTSPALVWFCRVLGVTPGNSKRSVVTVRHRHLI
jgi:hypothetical protein